MNRRVYNGGSLHQLAGSEFTLALDLVVDINALGDIWGDLLGTVENLGTEVFDILPAQSTGFLARSGYVSYQRSELQTSHRTRTGGGPVHG